MRSILLTLLALFITISLFGQVSVEGTWKAIDDVDGEPSSNILIKQANGDLTATITKIYNQPEDVVCEACTGDKKDQPIIGMEIISGMSQSGDSWKGGRILDPKNGKTYKCKLELDGKDILKVRGYIGIPALGRTQTWYRLGE